MSVESAPFSVALTPIYSRSRAVRSSGRVANHYPRSSTPLRDVNASSSTNKQQPAVKGKPAIPAVTAGKPATKRKSHAGGVRKKVAKSAVSPAAASKNDRVTASTVPGHSRFVESLAGELQKQKREVVDIWCSVYCISIHLFKSCTVAVSNFSVSVDKGYLLIFEHHVVSRCFDVVDWMSDGIQSIKISSYQGFLLINPGPIL